MRPFLELLPLRIGQMLGWRWLRARRAGGSRRRTAPPPDLTGAGRDKRRLFIDVAVISDHDAGTGIQRVVRALALAMLAEAGPGGAAEAWDIRFVSARRKRRYHIIAWPDRSAAVDAQEMRARPGDLFLGLDYSLDAVRRHRRQLARFRRDGGALWFLVHDLLPLHHPEWFSRNMVIRYKAWLTLLAGMADGFLCNSPHTEAELRSALEQLYGLTGGFRTQVLPMGHAIDTPALGRTAAAPRFDASAPFALMVGTLEPRKGHADVIAAFETLWRRGRTERLVLVGRLGWRVEGLKALITRHPENGRRLLWLDDVDDAELSAIYAASLGVIVASHGEGFGLPLIEALGHGKPVLARDLPVFRMHAGKGVRFFPVDASAGTLAHAAEQWLDAARQGTIQVTRPIADWQMSARTLLAAVEA